MKEVSTEDLVKIISDVVKEKVRHEYSLPAISTNVPSDSMLKVPVGVSNRHLHITKEDFEKLFGKGAQLTKLRAVTQKGQYAANETVSVETPKGKLTNLRIIGPFRSKTQVELAKTDCFRLGIEPPVKESGNLEGSVGATLVGPKGSVELKVGVLVAARHIHFPPEEAKKFNLNNGDRVSVYIPGNRGLILDNVIVRVRDDFVLDFHVDTDEANAANVKTGDWGYVLLERQMSIAEPEPSNGKKKLVTERLISEMAKRGETISDETRFIITPAARDLAVRLGMLKREI